MVMIMKNFDLNERFCRLILEIISNDDEKYVIIEKGSA